MDSLSYKGRKSNFERDSFETLEKMRNWSPEEIDDGHLSYCKEDGNTYRFERNSENDPTTGHWRLFRPDSGKVDDIPTYSQAILDDEKNAGKLSEEYILVPTPDELDGRVQKKTFTTQDNGSYLDIMFSTIRALQDEVRKLKNSFRYGIYSYTGTRTAMSDMIGGYEKTTEDEPLWAVEPDGLSIMLDSSVDIGANAQLKPEVNLKVVDNHLVVRKDTVWEDDSEEMRNCSDPKLFLYLICDNKNISITLESIPESNAEDILNLTFNTSNILNNFNYSTIPQSYGIMLVVSRADIDNPEIGFNYVWASIIDRASSKQIAQGYLDLSDTSNIKIAKRWEDNPEWKSKFTRPERLSFKQIKFENPESALYKLDFYSKYQDFSENIIPSFPDDDETEYKYKVAHLTIRSVDNDDEMTKVKSQLMDNELIWNIKEKQLYIKSKGEVFPVGSKSSNEDTGMTQEEMIQKLTELGIVYTDAEGLQLSDVGSVKFINQNTKKAYQYEVDSKGSLMFSELVPENEKLAAKIKELDSKPIKMDMDEMTFRGFAGSYFCTTSNPQVAANTTKDQGLNEDRIKIGALYCPLTTDVKHGCSHAYAELENTSDKDFPLDGCYLYFLRPEDPSTYESTKKLKESHISLSGWLRAGSTFLIRGKQYADKATDANVYISVDDYDMEWYDNDELVDFTVCQEYGALPYAFLLTYGEMADVTNNLTVRTDNTGSVVDKKKAPYFFKKQFIDCFVIDNQPSTNKWVKTVASNKPNTILKNTFELDPAKQAYNALNAYASSRLRFDNQNDIMQLSLDKEYIEFPNSVDVYPVSNFTPKSSKALKNISTDKSKLDKKRPNMVNCTFGINIFTTRCFNWISAFNQDEYVWIKDANGENWHGFESYKQISQKGTQDTGFPRRKEFSPELTNAAYARMYGNFPGDETAYTVHKCIIELTENSVSEKTLYTYVVGPADKSGLKPDLERSSDEMTFTLYPESYTPRIYQTTDQQGFHWIEYQAWAAAAIKLDELITKESAESNIIPILINTGDMTQNGTRVNEWLDYWNGGRNLFKHLEHMCVVGNNDLCGTDFSLLGTGDDIGKSNSYYFHVFYCYEVTDEEKYRPVINQKYIPSLYYFDSKDYRFMMINSELTFINCRDWFGLGNEDGSIYNIYTGWKVYPTANDNSDYSNKFTSVYTMIYHMLATKGDKKPIAICHEMPFTVITTEGLKNGTESKSRSDTGALVGSHMNQISINDTHGIYWFSRLMEYWGVKLVLGGHKHTFACTFPIQEHYKFKNSDGLLVESSGTNIMQMNETLEHDGDTVWSWDGKNYTKFPYIVKPESVKDEDLSGFYYPYVTASTLNHSVVYFMCQATGYKQASNKELPSDYQGFSCLIPGQTDGKAAADQKFPMFAVVYMEDESKYDIKLVRVKNVMTDDKKHVFTQLQHGTSAPSFEYAKSNIGNTDPKVFQRHCSWVDTDSVIVSVSK